MNHYKTFTQAYYHTISHVLCDAKFTCSPRGQLVKENLCHSFSISNPMHRLSMLKGRNFSPAYVVAEAIWYFSGRDDINFIANYSGFWRNISDDGSTANSAYGARIFRPHPRASTPDGKSQWQYVIDELARDPDSRRAVIHVRSAQDDILTSKDVPCTVALQFFVRNDEVHLVASMRSNDVLFGLPNDVAAFTLFQEAMALELTRALQRPIGVGTYYHTANSMHAYERDFERLRAIVVSEDNHHTASVHGFGGRQGGDGFGMFKMPSMPPTDDLIRFESKIRSCDNSQAIEGVLLESKTSETLNHSYWYDWCLLLASHRAAKLGDKDLEGRLMSNLTYRGYVQSKA